MKLLLYLFFFLLPLYLISQNCTTTDGTFCKCPDGKDTCLLLPDIKISNWAMQNYLNGPSEYGPTRHGLNNGRIRISGSTPNIGSGALTIKPTQLWTCGIDTFNFYPMICPGGDLPKQLIKQLIYKKEGNNITVSERLAGSMSYHPTHQHVHIDDWTIFTLRKEDPSEPDTLKWPIIGNGSKISYCLMDYGTCSYYSGHCRNNQNMAMMNTDFSNFGMGGGNYVCSPFEQGISVGHTDLYEEFFDGMWIDLPPGLCNGDYWIVAEVDPWNSIQEENENNNFSAIPITLKEQITVNENLELTADKLVLNNLIEIGDNDTVRLSPVAYGATYLWSTGDTSFSIAVTASGKYFVRVESLCGFVYSDTIEVNKIHIAAPQIAADTICLNHPVQLTSSTATQEQIIWFNAVGVPLDTGNVFTSNPLSASTTFFAEVQKIMPDTIFKVGAPDSTIGPSGYTFDVLHGLYFDAHRSFFLRSVVVNAGSSGVGVFVINDNTNKSIYSKPINIQKGTHRIPLNITIPKGKNYHFNIIGIDVLRNTNGADYPYSIPGVMDITGNPYAQGYYYYFYDWEIEVKGVIQKSARTKIEVVVEQCTGIEPVSRLYGIKIFPSPANNHLNIHFKATTGATGVVELFNINGSKVMQQEYSHDFEEKWDVSQLTNGIYFIRISSDGEIFHEKVVIQR